MVCGDKAALAARAADIIADRATKGPMNLGLAGGSTPAATYRDLAQRGIDWSTVSMWLSDERWVPPDHADSNGRMALENLHADASDRLVRPRWSPSLDPLDVAAFYEADLRALFDGTPPNLVMLGMGDDGHTASLFPDSPALEAPAGRWFVANRVSKLDTWRLTATAELLQRAEHTIVLVAGAAKASVLAEVIDGPGGVHPIQLLRRCEGAVTVLCDEDASTELAE